MEPRFAAVRCPSCGEPWAVELRHEFASCSRCSTRVALRKAARIWSGDDARGAQAAIAVAKGGSAPLLLAEPRTPRHDSPLDAAAAQARSATNKSERAELVALWLTRLQGGARHDELLEALARAGLERERAEREVVRMLACDIVTEARPGFYRAISS